MAIVNQAGLRSPQSLIKLRELAAKTLAQLFNTRDTLEESITTVLTAASSQTFQEFDRSWIFEVCSGVLRYRGRIDYIIDTYSLKKKPTGILRRFLQIGVFQLLAQDVIAGLAVSETVQALKANDSEQSSKFANAILRKVADRREEWRSWKVTEKSPFEEQLAWCSLPEWLFKKLRKERGSPWVFAFSAAVLERPQTWYRTENEAVQLENGYQGNEPLGFVQDISNQQLVEQVSEFLKTRFQQSPKILDLCSAPGGKSLGLALDGFSVTATDIDADRMQKVIENRARLKLESKISITPIEAILSSDEKYDLIWIDAPCSSLGIMRRHPEIKWNRNEEDIAKLVQKQRELVEWAKTRLSANGLIVYSTCSVLKSENTVAQEELTLLKTLEWNPSVAPFGDGIHAVFLEKKA